MKFNFNLSFKWASLLAIALVSACSSRPAGHAGGSVNSTDLRNFGAKYEGRTYQQSHLAAVAGVDNHSAVINQADFLTQLSNVHNYSGRLSGQYSDVYNKITGWVLAGANTGELSSYGIRPQIMKGHDGYQNVLMTGYYSPVIHARRSPQGRYNQPIYALPAKKRFSRAQIYAGALKNKGLELAYSDSMIDNFLLGVQGSGYVDFGDGNLNYFAYAGQNGFPYTAVGRLLVEQGEIEKEKMSIQAIRDWAKANPSRLQALLERNQSYVFFKNDPTGQVKGSAGVPLVPMAAIASDRNIIPSGSVLLVEVPQMDNGGNWTGEHQLRLMVALDVGGAVKGHHFDLYRGIGDEAGHIAGLSKHYGRVWLLQ
ncbi:membrane-bound lytic murein transglycosylase A [Mesocricetibacter intestinalis]|uniref:Membrane-bound lytic murein transglycosylase A n=1 Tax=Mesocricetibacter intestinalis TaxID=1521930 RepID=A0A4R6VCY9_9PAST|nr:murein transglycosylase A [Mesocricetibacter intestinalis]TDQ59726.1 membrane-bound lytic murein transglycosylase A [Mesocricetibacter intestinalis]